MNKYDSYKDSGVEWIGQIPEHWSYSRLKHYSKNKTGTTPSKLNKEYWENGTIPWMSSGEVNQRKINKISKSISEKAFDETSLELFPPSSIMIAMNGQGKTKGKVGILEVSTTFNQSLTGFKFNESIVPSFIYYYLDSKYYQLRGLVGEDREGLSSAILKNIYFPLPPLNEQTAIATYLDQKTTEIDDLISKKERLIELLEEEKTAVINQAVTKGLDSNVPMKDSGVEWLGEIPENWKLTRMRYLCDIGTGDKDTENKEEDAEYPFFVRSQTVERISTYSFDGEAILTAGDGVGVCKVWHYIDGKFDYHQRVYRISNFQKVKGKYVFYFLKMNFIKEVKKLSAKSTVDSLRRPMFQNFQIAYGTIQEQNEIVELIEEHTEKVNFSIEKMKKELNYLREYKIALISEVVTGKVDVRDEVLVK